MLEHAFDQISGLLGRVIRREPALADIGNAVALGIDAAAPRHPGEIDAERIGRTQARPFADQDDRGGGAEQFADVIGEREDRYREVVAEIGGSWGGPQRVIGPILVVPFRVPSEPRADGTPLPPLERQLVILPDRYMVEAKAAPETRKRGLFEAVVYTVDLALSGQFLIGDAASLAGPQATIDWSAAYLYVGVADPRSIREGASLRWGDRDLPFQPGAPGELGQRLGAVGGDGDAVALALERVGDGQREIVVVLDDQEQGIRPRCLQPRAAGPP